ncbi:MAG: sensor histidine kinase [Frankiales bacterium]|nr:sensor histidine kinase [Frankiales bacterium]
MTAPRVSLQRRLLLGVVGVAVVTAAVTGTATVAGFLVVAEEHPIGANRVGGRILAELPGRLTTAQVGLALVVLGVVLVTSAVGTAVSLGERVLRPIGRLADAADRMAAGDLSVRVPPDGDDEIADVAQSFNHMARSLQESVTTLQRMEETARRFAADVSHELRTPLASMVAVTDVLSAHGDGMSADAARATHLVVREIGHLDRLVTDLIEVSRFDAGTALLDAEWVDVAAALDATLVRRGWTDQVQVRAPEGLTASLDLRRFDLVLANLVGNALKYGSAPVVVTAQEGPEGIAVDVTDCGPGIPHDALPHLFERFYKADAARARSDGSGLGLAIALENARLHGGDLTAANRPDGGAVFRFTAPAAVRPAPPRPPPPR